MTNTDDTRNAPQVEGATPGPWEVIPVWSLTHMESRSVKFGPADHQTITLKIDPYATKEFRKASIREAKANARLIASEPDMLEALRLALPFVRNDNAAKVIRAAIAKATGGAA